MQLFVGLGNPGAKHARNRHNIGFMALDTIAAEHGFGPWRSKFQAEIAEGRIGSSKILLVKPQTFMNESGRAVGEAVRFFRSDPTDVLVFHDELDLQPGKVRVKQGGGHAGHNGLRSLHAHIGAAYRRVRLGIGHPGDKSRVSGYVLHDFAVADKEWLKPLLDAIAREARFLADGDAPGFQNALGLRLAPPRSAPARGPASASQDTTQKPEDAGPTSPFAGLVKLLRRT